MGLSVVNQLKMLPRKLKIGVQDSASIYASLSSEHVTTSTSALPTALAHFLLSSENSANQLDALCWETYFVKKDKMLSVRHKDTGLDMCKLTKRGQKTMLKSPNAQNTKSRSSFNALDSKLPTTPRNKGQT